MTTPTRHTSLQGVCTHRFYLMSCDDFDALEQHALGRCQLCDVLPQDTPERRLVIDHVPTLGNWAVRGLLCSRCNSLIGKSPRRLNAEQLERYLADPWYQRLLDEAGVTSRPPEPPDGTVLQDGKGWPWTRSGDRWIPLDRRCGPLDWRTLVQRRGPHLLRVESPAPDSLIMDGEQ